MKPAIYFFGCWQPGEVGHFLHEPGGSTRCQHAREFVGDVPWVKLDGGKYQPQNGQDEAVLRLTQTPKVTVLGCWDRTVDKRPGSCAAFIAEGRLNLLQMLALACRHFPAQAMRLKALATAAPTLVNHADLPVVNVETTGDKLAFTVKVEPVKA